MPCCIIPMCQNAPDNNNDSNQGRITFHNFPNDGLIREIWTKIIQKTLHDECWKPSAVSAICSDHFKNEDFYISNKGLRILKRESLPSNIQTTSEPVNVISSTETVKVSQIKSILSPSDPKPENLKPTQTVKYLQMKSDLSTLSYFSQKYAKIIKALSNRHDRLIIKQQSFEKAFNNLKSNPISKELLYDLVSDGVLTSKDLLDIKKIAWEKKKLN